MKPRVLIAGRTHYALPLEPSVQRKFDALVDELDLRVLGSGNGGDATFHLYPDLGTADVGAFPLRVARELASFRPQAVLVQGAHETALVLAARKLVGSDAKVILDLHGDWRAPTRLYGSSARRLLNPVADRAAEAALRNADAVRSITPYTTRLLRDLGVDAADEFPAFMDLDVFGGDTRSLPERPRALFVGVLERYKGLDVLLEAWPEVERRVPDAELRLVGSGTLEPVVRGLDWTPRLAPEEVARALDDAWCLVLPSRSEGMGRVVVEAFCRGRAVVGSRVGGIPDLVTDGLNGRLVAPEDGPGLASAVAGVLSDRALAARLGEGAHRSAERFLVPPEEFARRLRALVERVVH